MSGTVTISNTFASQSGNVPASQLDSNFTTLAVYVNDPSNRNNYAADTGAANAYTVNPTPTWGGYTAGMGIIFKAATANTGSSAINISGLGATTIAKGGATNLDAGDILANQIIPAVYDGTRFQIASGYSSNTCTLTLAGSSTLPTATATYIVNGRMVEFDMPAIVQTTSTATSKTVGPLPPAIRPATAKEFIVQTQDNGGAYVAARATLGTDGTITYFATINGGSFTTSGTYSTRAWTFPYTLA